MTTRSINLLVLACLAACGTTDADDSGPLVQVATATSTSGAYDVSLLAHASTLTRGNYTLQYVVTSTADGSPVDNLELTIVPWMPAMGHGTSITPTVTGLGSGTYELDDIDLFMAGLWQLRTTSGSDSVEPSLQVE
jgi:YtkA-like